jgi:hypothetical protein
MGYRLYNLSQGEGIISHEGDGLSLSQPCIGYLHNAMVGFANTTAIYMLEHLFLSYGSITDVNLEHNWEKMRKAWDPHQPV